MLSLLFILFISNGIVIRMRAEVLGFQPRCWGFKSLLEQNAISARHASSEAKRGFEISALLARCRWRKDWQPPTLACHYNENEITEVASWIRS